MKHYVQPEESTICGQCSLAMATKTPIEDVFKFIGHKHHTNTAELSDFLRNYAKNYKLRAIEDQRKRIELNGKRGVLLIFTPYKNIGHAVAFVDGKVYDPAGTVFESLAALKKHYKVTQNWRKVYVGYVYEVEPQTYKQFAVGGDPAGTIDYTPQEEPYSIVEVTL